MPINFAVCIGRGPPNLLIVTPFFCTHRDPIKEVFIYADLKVIPKTSKAFHAHHESKDGFLAGCGGTLTENEKSQTTLWHVAKCLHLPIVV